MTIKLCLICVTGHTLIDLDAQLIYVFITEAIMALFPSDITKLAAVSQPCVVLIEVHQLIFFFCSGVSAVTVYWS